MVALRTTLRPGQLATLDDRDAAAVLLASRPGVSYREVAELLGEEPRVTLARLRSALTKLREAPAAQR